MSQVERKEACPNCRALGKDKHGDNLAVYSDGHKWCYSCSYYIPASDKDRILKYNDYSHGGNLALPDDTTDDIAFLGMQWLSKYGITRDEVKKFRLLWSDKRKWLIFPVFSGESETLLMYQSKVFGQSDGPKYITFGSPERTVNYLHQQPVRADNLIVVEDMVSAMKLSRYFTVLPLYGSMLSPPKIGRLQFSQIEQLIFWLDFDKKVESLKMAQRAKSFGFKTSVIVTQRDPKEYSNQEIVDIVSPSLIKGKPSDRPQREQTCQ